MSDMDFKACPRCHRKVALDARQCPCGYDFYPQAFKPTPPAPFQFRITPRVAICVVLVLFLIGSYVASRLEVTDRAIGPSGATETFRDVKLEQAARTIEIGDTKEHVIALLGEPPLSTEKQGSIIDPGRDPNDYGTASRYDLADGTFIGLMYEYNRVTGIIHMRGRDVLYKRGVTPTQQQIDTNTPSN